MRLSVIAVALALSVSSAFAQNLNLFDEEEAAPQAAAKATSKSTKNAAQAAGAQPNVVVVTPRAARRMEVEELIGGDAVSTAANENDVVIMTPRAARRMGTAEALGEASDSLLGAH